MIIGSAINKRDNHNHSNPKSLPNPSVKPPPINNQARGTGFALVKARNQSTVHPSNKIKLISSPTKKRIKPWNKQHLEIHLNTTKHVDVAQFQLSLKKGSVNSSAGNDDVPSTIASLSSNVICCVGASGIVSGTMNIGYLGIMPVRKRKNPKISDSLTKPLPEKVKKDEPKKVETIQKEAANVLKATNTIPIIQDSNETIEATNTIETILSDTDLKTKEPHPNECKQLAISTETVTETLTATSATATSIEPSTSQKYIPTPSNAKVAVHVMTMHGMMDIALEEYDSVIVVNGHDASLPGNVRSFGTGLLSIVKGTEIELYLNDIDLIDGGDGGVHDGEVLVMDGSHALKKEIVEVYNDYQKVNGLKTKTKWNGYNRKQHVVEERNLLLSCLARANGDGIQRRRRKRKERRGEKEDVDDNNIYVLSNGTTKRKRKSRFINEMVKTKDQMEDVIGEMVVCWKRLRVL